MNTQYSKMTQKRSSIPGVIPKMGLTNNHLDGTWDGTSIYPGELFYNMSDNLLWIGNPNGPVLINIGNNFDMELINNNFDNINILIDEINIELVNLNNEDVIINNNYNLLKEFSIKCCELMNKRLTEIEYRLKNLVVVKQTTIKVPTPVYINNGRPAYPIKPIKQPDIIIEEYVIDQTLRTGYLENRDWLTNWMINGGYRKLSPKNIIYLKGSIEAENILNALRETFESYGLTLNEKELYYRVPKPDPRHWTQIKGPRSLSTNP